MWWAIALKAANAHLQAGSAWASAKMQKTQLKHQANIANINAGIARQQAEGAFIQGRSQIASAMRQQGQALARQRASLASRGIDMGYGSAAESRATGEFFKEMDYNTLSANALRNAWGYRQEATNLENQAAMTRANANAIDPGMQVISTLLADAAQNVSMFGGSSSTPSSFNMPTWMKDTGQGIGASTGTGSIGFTGTGKIGFQGSSNMMFGSMPSFSVPTTSYF